MPREKTPQEIQREEAAIAEALAVRGLKAPEPASLRASAPVATAPESERRPARRPARVLDPEQEAMQIAKEMRVQELQERQARLLARRRQKEAPGLAKGQIRPRRLYRRLKRPDNTIVMDSQGNPIPLRPGYVRRHVRMFDHEGRPTAARLADWKLYGAEPVKDPHTGEEKLSMYGAAIDTPVEGYADRMLNYSQEGALADADRAMHDLSASIRDFNKKAGEEVAYLYEGKEHGSRRVQEYDAEMTEAMHEGGSDSDGEEYDQ